MLLLDRFPRLWFSPSVVTGFAMLLVAEVAAAQQPPSPPDLSTLDLEQLMQIEIVVAASKRAQHTREVPSFVSLVRAAEIREHGYRTLADVLRALPSFYITNDRLYSYVGVRGFQRPGDYNTRVLLLLNGLRTNDNIIGQESVGEEFIDLDLVERIEVIRGPSAAVYGSNAFFAVINVVTKQGRGLNGSEVAATAASFGTYIGRATYGTSLGDDGDVLVSGTLADSKGQRLFFPEFNSPATDDGFADRVDGYHAVKLFATATKGNFSLQGSNFSLDKRLPTTPLTPVFNNPDARSNDVHSLASLIYRRSLAAGTSLSTGVRWGRWSYHGYYSLVPGVATEVVDFGEWWTVDADASKAFSRHFLTVGSEYQYNSRQDQRYFVEPSTTLLDLQKHSAQAGLFAQDEIKLLEELILYLGVRYDHYETFGTETSPRVGLIYNSRTGTTLKLLAGRAFRAPNEHELYFEAGPLRANPALIPERIETIELVAQRLIGGGVQLTASAFRNQLSALINQQVMVNGSDISLKFDNVGSIQSKGVELGVDVNRGHGVWGQLTYSLQRSEDRDTGAELTSSPRQMGKFQIRMPLLGNDLLAGVDAQYVSALKTSSGGETDAYFLANLSLLSPRLFDRFAVSASAYNLFDTRHAAPSANPRGSDTVEQDGRSLRLKTIVTF